MRDTLTLTVTAAERSLIVCALEAAATSEDVTRQHHLLMLAARIDGTRPGPGAAFRIRWQRRGAHVHCRVFQRGRGETYAKNGDVVFDDDGWATFRQTLGPSVDVVEDE